MQKIPKKLQILLIYLALALATFIAFEQVRLNDFVSYDDGQYVTNNSQVQSGLTRQSIIWSLTSPGMGNWHPLTWLSHMLDCQLYELNPAGHHLTNLLFHIVNTLLLFWILKNSTHALWPSAFIAAVFALHPLHVESVAWVAERKAVLSGFFWMLTLGAYIHYTRKPGIAEYLLVVLALGLGLMAKPMLVTLPFVLLLLDYWPLERLKWTQPNNSSVLPTTSVTAGPGKISAGYLVVEKIPLFVLVAVSCTITFVVQRNAGGVKPLSLGLRTSNILVSYISYIGKTFYPKNLAVLYPFQKFPVWQTITAFLILILVSAAVFYLARRRRKALAVGWLWYLGTLVPVIGLVQVGIQRMADRYTYLPSIGIYLMIACGLAAIADRWRLAKITLTISVPLLLVAMIICTRIQVRHWHNSLTLFSHTLDVTEDNYNIHSNYGLALMVNDRSEEAVEHFEKALQIKPIYFHAQRNMAEAYLLMGKTEQAVDCWYKTLQLSPDEPTALNNLAWIRAAHQNPNLRNPDEAVRLAMRACKTTEYNQPDHLDTLAVAYAAAGEFTKAIETAEKAAQLVDDDNKNLATQIQNRIELYKTGRPYREPTPPQDRPSR